MPTFVKLKEHSAAKTFTIAADHIVYVSEEPGLASHVHLLNGQNLIVEHTAEEIQRMIREELAKEEAYAEKMRRALNAAVPKP
jgi:uncharacterized protein YlzI (FlbEa/FlbD family)